MIYPNAKHKLSIINTASRPYLRWLNDGVKTAEGRVNGFVCQRMQVGESILLFDKKTEQYIFGLISRKSAYKNFEQMLLSEGMKNMLPFLSDEASILDGVRVYESFPQAYRVKKFGCVAIAIEIKECKI